MFKKRIVALLLVVTFLAMSVTSMQANPRSRSNVPHQTGIVTKEFEKAQSHMQVGNHN